MRVQSELTPFNVTFTWFRIIDNGTREQLAPQLGTVEYGSTVMNRLSITTESPGTHKYICRVTLNLSPAPDQIMEESSGIEVIVNGELVTSIHAGYKFAIVY